MDHINEEILKSLLENRMSRVAQAQVRHHIRTCFRCEQKLKEWRESFDALSEEPHSTKSPGPPPPIRGEPTVLVPAPPIALSRHSRRVVRSVLAFGLVLVVVLVVETFRQGREPNATEGASQAGALIERSEAALQAGIEPVAPGTDEATAVGGVAARDSSIGDPPPEPAEAQEARTVAPSPRTREVAGAAVAPTPAPARPAGVSAPGFSVVNLREAIERLGGPLLLIRGLLPDHIEVADASAVPGALPGSVVVRLVYREPDGRLMLLDQQKIPAAYRTGLAADTLIDSDPNGNSIAVWVSGDTRLMLTGRMDPETLRVFVRRVD